ncbi:MAG: ATPase [Myxococcales bacterium]|nr:ATPase [Myxococcales bacterium]
MTDSSGKIPSRREITDLIKARYVLLYVISHEEERALNLIRDIATKEVRHRRKVFTWSVTEGIQGEDGESMPDHRDPMRALDFAVKLEEHAIFVLKDFHPFMKDPGLVRKLRDIHRAFSEGRTIRHIVLLSGIFKMPPELEKEVAVIDFDLPDRQELDGIVENAIHSLPPNTPLALREDADLRDRVVEAALGLTAEEAKNVFAKSLVRSKDFDFDVILSEKKNIIRKSGLLEFFESRYEMTDIGGLLPLKAWLSKRQKAFSKKARDFGLPLPKGILLIGIPGCGKSLTAKAVGSLWRMPLLRLDVGKVFGSLVGSSEENIRKVIRTAEAVAPSILWLDELEKGFAGVQSSGETDSGTTARVFASFITWLQEKDSPVFVIATANDVSALPPELLRKGRFDEIFFVDLPNAKERSDIVRIHLGRKNRNPDDFDIEAITQATQNFSGSEVEQGIVSALYDAFDEDIEVTSEHIEHSCREIIPLAFTMKEKIDKMREWSKARARMASTPAEEVEAEDTPLEM